MHKYIYNNPKSFNKSNIDLSVNGQSNYRFEKYENNTSNISYQNQNVKIINISNDTITFEEIQKKIQ